MNLLISQNKPLVSEYHREGRTFLFEYYDVDHFDDLPLERIKQVYGVCFYQDDLVIVLSGKANTWGLVGGTREEGETIEQTLIREVQEEANMEVVSWKPVGVQKVINPEKEVYYQLRVVCLVKPYGEFISDPAGTISEVKFINPKKYKKYFDWGEIGERIIQRAADLKLTL